MIDLDASSTIYVDTNILIYFIDGHAAVADRAEDFFRAAGDGGARLVTSELTIAECIYKPYRDRDHRRIALYEAAFRSGFVDIYPLTGDLAIRAAREGGSLGLKLNDAIHFLSALESGCDLFVTADGRFRSAPYLRVANI